MNDWFEAEQRVERAYEMYESGRWEEALQELQAAVDVNPYKGEWHFNMGLTLDAMGRSHEAVSCYRKAIDLNQQEVGPDAYDHLGVACIRAGHPAEALEAFGESIRLDPHRVFPYVHQIEAFRQIGDHDQAETAFYMSVQLEEENSRAFVFMGLSQLDRNEYDRALQCFGRARQIDPFDPDVFAHIGEAHLYKGEYEKARRAYQRQLQIDASDVPTMIDLGRVLSRLGRPHDAMEQFRRATELDPAEADAHFEMGCLHAEAGRLDAARLAFELVLRLEGNTSACHQKLASIALKNGQLLEARRHLNAALPPLDETFEMDVEDAERLSQLLMEAGMRGHAELLLQTMTQKHPEDAELLHQLAVAQFLEGNLRAGIQSCRKALRVDPTHLSAMQNLVVAHLRQENLAHARVWLHRALTLSGEDKRTRHLHGQFYMVLVRVRIRGFLRRPAR